MCVCVLFEIIQDWKIILLRVIEPRVVFLLIMINILDKNQIEAWFFSNNNIKVNSENSLGG